MIVRKNCWIYERKNVQNIAISQQQIKIRQNFDYSSTKEALLSKREPSLHVPRNSVKVSQPFFLTFFYT